MFAAAIAYYMVFSIPALLVLSISFASRVFDQALVEGQIVAQVEEYIAVEVAALLESLLQNAARGSSSYTLISTIILIWAASGVFNHLKRALDMIYGVIPMAIPGIKGIIHMIRTRFLTFVMVILMGVLLLAAFALNAVAATLGSYLNQYLTEIISINAVVTKFITPAIMFLLFAILFRMLPEAQVAWRDVWLGSAITTLLVSLGVYFIGLYLNIANVGSVYGAAGSLIVIMVWIYYSTQILMFGAEITKIYAHRYGQGIVPRKNATSLAEYYNNIAPDILADSTPVEIASEPQQPTEDMDLEFIEVIPPANQARKQVAAGLIGLAVGLFLAFISQLRKDE